MLKNILIPLDGSPTAEKIVEWSESLAAPFESELTLLSVVDPDRVVRPNHGHGRDRPSSGAHPLDNPPGADDTSTGLTYEARVATKPETEITIPEVGYGTQVIEQVAQNVNALLSEVANRIAAKGFSVRAMVAIGSPADEILKVAEEQQIDLIAMATHRESTLARGILGSITDRIIRSSSRPVLTLRPESVLESESVSIDNILVPLDGSQLSESAIPFAMQIAKRLGAPLTFARVTNQIYTTAMASAGVYDSSPISRAGASEFAREYLEPFVDEARKAGVSAALLTPSGNPSKNLISIADENENTLIVISTRGHSGLRRFIVGSVTDKVIRTSAHPVLVIPPTQS